MLTNYRQALENKNFEDYYKQYTLRVEWKIKKISFVEFNRDIHTCINIYASLLAKTWKTEEDIKMQDTIYQVYQDIINDAIALGNSKIANKF